MAYLMNFEDYTTYISELCHLLKSMGDRDFVNQILSFVDIDGLLNLGRKKHALYTVAMIDYVSKENNIPLNPRLEIYRNMKMDELSFPQGVETYAAVVRSDDVKKTVLSNAVDEFLVYNIVETSVRDVC